MKTWLGKKKDITQHWEAGRFVYVLVFASCCLAVYYSVAIVRLVGSREGSIILLFRSLELVWKGCSNGLLSYLHTWLRGEVFFVLCVVFVVFSGLLCSRVPFPLPALVHCVVLVTCWHFIRTLLLLALHSSLVLVLSSDSSDLLPEIRSIVAGPKSLGDQNYCLTDFFVLAVISFGWLILYSRQVLFMSWLLVCQCIDIVLGGVEAKLLFGPCSCILFLRQEKVEVDTV